ncbi:MAG TPA: 1-acyl-sn-glycerol-3-phosphate acyltransferase, partial [Cellvibrionaceae bacterium]
MSEFDDIRPYNDDEVAPIIERLLKDPELILAVTKLRFPRASGPFGWLLRPLVRQVLARQVKTVNSVDDFQMVVKKYLRHMIDTTTTGLSCSGLDKLEKGKPYLFISNHRDITLDPGFVNWTLYFAGFNTLKIAIGDNLLTKPYVTDLMRINKSFIVNRSA